MLAIAIALAVLAASFRSVQTGNRAFTRKNSTDTFEAFGTCSDREELYRITTVSSGYISYVEDKDAYKFKWHEQGVAYLEPISASSPVIYISNYTVNLMDRLHNDTSIFKHIHTNVGFGSDNTHEVFHLSYHVIVTPNGLVREVDSFQWICSQVMNFQGCQRNSGIPAHTTPKKGETQ